MVMKKIWIIYDDDSKAITAPTWEAAVHAWVHYWYVTGDTRANWNEIAGKYNTLRKRCGKDWQGTLIAWGSKVFNDMYDGEFFADQIPYYEE